MTDGVKRVVLRFEGMGFGRESAPARASAYVLEFDGERFCPTGEFIEVLHLGMPLPSFTFAWVQKIRDHWFIISADD